MLLPMKNISTLFWLSTVCSLFVALLFLSLRGVGAALSVSSNDASVVCVGEAKVGSVPNVHIAAMAAIIALVALVAKVCVANHGVRCLVMIL